MKMDSAANLEDEDSVLSSHSTASTQRSIVVSAMDNTTVQMDGQTDRQTDRHTDRQNFVTITVTKPMLSKLSFRRDLRVQ